MTRVLTTDSVGDVTETIALDEGSGTLVVRRSQDAQPMIDRVAAANVDGVQSIDGLGVPQSEVPIAVAIEWCERRGILWEAFAYTNDYDDEWGKFLRSHPNLAYRPAKRYHGA